MTQSHDVHDVNGRHFIEIITFLMFLLHNILLVPIKWSQFHRLTHRVSAMPLIEQFVWRKSAASPVRQPLSRSHCRLCLSSRPPIDSTTLLITIIRDVYIDFVNNNPFFLQWENTTFRASIAKLMSYWCVRTQLVNLGTTLTTLAIDVWIAHHLCRQ